jgi:hypothetical protein
MVIVISLLTILGHLILGNAKELAKDENSELSINTISEMKKFIKNNILALAVQQERERVLTKAKDILYKEAEYYGTDKHGLSYEQLESINQNEECLFDINPWESLSEAIIHRWFEEMEFTDEYKEQLKNGTAIISLAQSHIICSAMAMEESSFWKNLYANYNKRND